MYGKVFRKYFFSCMAGLALGWLIYHSQPAKPANAGAATPLPAVLQAGK